MSSNVFRRPQGQVLAGRLTEPRRFIQLVAGARQVGKTTLVQQVVAASGLPVRFASADEPTLRGPGWIAEQWEAARVEAGRDDGILVLDEVQKAAGWAESVKRLWDEDTRARRRLRVILLGSAPLLVREGTTESLAGRFEVLHLPHWSFQEMNEAFAFSLEEYLFFGGYPGAAPFKHEPDRWRRYILDSLVETTLSRDVLLMTRVTKPALLRQLFELGCRYSGQVLSYTKMLGPLQDAGNTTTLAHYIQLLASAGLLTGLEKYSGSALRRRGSSPKLQVMNTALMTAVSGLLPGDVQADRSFNGRLVESAVGAHLANAAAARVGDLFYWREGHREVDFVLRFGRTVVAIEVKSGSREDRLPGMDAFTTSFPGARRLLVGSGGIALAEFLSRPVENWLQAMKFRAAT